MDTPTPSVPTPSEPLPTVDDGASPMTKAVMTLAVLLLLGATGAAGYFYKQLSEVKTNPNKVAADQTTTTIAAVGRLILLPNDEQPTLATVTNSSPIADQVFFANIQAGDQVLIYTNAKEAILYRPSDDKIVAVAPLNIGVSTTPESIVSGATTTKATARSTKK